MSGRASRGAKLPHLHAAVASIVAVAALASGWAAAQGTAPRTIGDLPKRPVPVERGRALQATPAQAIENYRRYLEADTRDPELRAEALRRLGDLNLEAGEAERIDREVSSVDSQAREAIRFYTTLLTEYPDYVRSDQVLYQLARAYETTAQPEQALATLDELLKRFPATPELDEIEFRRGELLFSAGRYPEAEQAYARVLAQGTSGGFHLQSLYKHGWSRFKQGLNEECLGSFAGVLDAKLQPSGGAGDGVAIDALSRADRELVEDTLRVMSVTFTYLDGTDSLGRFVAERGQPSYSHLLYDSLGNLYVEKQRYQDAAVAYRAYADLNPLDVRAIPLARRSIEAYGQGGFSELVIDGRRDYVARYRFDGPFWQGRTREQFPEVVQELRTGYRDLATWYHAAAQRSAKPADFLVAAGWYRDYLAAFPDEPTRADTRYLLAETLLAGEQYPEAVAQFETVAYDAPGFPRAAEAGYASLVAYQRERERLAGDAQRAWHERQIAASTRFADSFPAHPDAGGVRVRAAQDVFALGDLPRAITLAEAALAHRPAIDPARQRIAWSIIGQSYFDQGVFDKAESAYARAVELAPARDPIRTDLSGRLAGSMYRQGEALRAAGSGAAAVAAFSKAADTAPDPEVRATALYDAAALQVTMQDWAGAIVSLEEYRRRHPRDARQADVRRNLAVAYKEAGRPIDAAREFERIANAETEEPALRREALLTAADLFIDGGYVTRGRGVLERYVKEYPAPLADAIEVRQRLAELAGGARDEDARRRWLRDVIRADADAGAARSDRTRTLAARAQLALTEPARDSFRAIKLVAPLRRSLDAKRRALDKALAGYRTAAEYRVADVATRATYEMADLYRRLGQDLLASERPPRLSAEEREQYDLLLEEQAFPFEEQAIELHELNLGRAREGFFDDAVRTSLAELAALKPARYGKTEQQADRIVAAAPAEALRRANLGLERRRAGDLEAAAAELSAAAALDAGNAAIWSELGVTQRLRGRFAEAEVAYGRALGANSGDPAANRNMGVLLDVYLDQPARALEFLERYAAAAGEGDRQAAAWVADVRQRTRKPGEAGPGDGGAPAPAAEPEPRAPEPSPQEPPQ
jgi:tetratricopeptide (TPR) repeat protein